jgi:hypothetical protein
MSKDKIFLFLTLILVIFIAFALDVPRYFFEQRGQFIVEHLKNNNAIKDDGIVKKPIRAKGAYVTYRTASNSRMDEIIDLIKRTELNSVVIDIKDYTGRIPFQTESDLIHEAGSEKIFIKDIKGLIDNLHKEGIYAIARIAVFEDNYLPREKSELALKNSGGGLWSDNNGLTWLDPASKDVWDYTIAIAKESIKVGFDEINLDYIRFPSDGATALIKYPFWDKKTPRTEVIKSFFEYFNSRIKPLGVFISADLFGLTLTGTNDLNIGQWLEYAAPYFDYICPMVYPSHYPIGFLGFENPAAHPYEIIYNGLTKGMERLASVSASDPSISVAKLRPWLQDFNMGAIYDARMIELQKKAVYDAGADGWLLWNPKNIYTESGLEKEE